MSNKLSKKIPNLSRIGLGTVQFGIDYGFSKALDQSDVNKILEAAYENNVRFLDTAREYGNSEDKIKTYCRQNPQRSGFCVATKFSIIEDKTILNWDYMTRNHLRESLKESMIALGKNYLPLVFVHQTDADVMNNPEFWEALAQIKDNPWASSFGISVYDPKVTKEIIEKRGDLIDCIQAPYNVFNRQFESLIELLKEKKIGFISRSTFLKGALVEDKIPEELRGLEPVRKRLKEISKKSGFTVPQLLTLFALHAKFIDCTLIGVRSADQLRENLGFRKYLDESPEQFLKIKEELLNLPEVDDFLKDPRQWELQ